MGSKDSSQSKKGEHLGLGIILSKKGPGKDRIAMKEWIG